MKIKDASLLLAALSAPARLDVFRLLVTVGPEGLPAGRIGEQCGIAPSALSFHLKELTHAGLTTSRQDGRFIFYAANYEAMNGLIAFLTENCCQGQACETAGMAERAICKETP